MKRNILYVIPSLCGGGAEKVLALLVKYSNPAEYNINIVTFQHYNDYSDEVPESVKIICLNKINKYDNIRIVFVLSRIIRILSPDIVCSFLYYANYLSVLSRIISRRRSVNILTEHNNLTKCVKLSDKSNIKTLLIRCLYRYAGHIICVSKGIELDLLNRWGVDYRKLSVIYNPIEYDRIQELAKVDLDVDLPFNRSSFIMSCGRLVEQKNHILLIKAFNRIKHKISSDLVILGDGPMRGTMERLIEDFMLKDRVFLLGFQSNPFKFMSKTQVFVLSSSWEGFGNVLVEAMASGASVVSTDCQYGPSEIILDGHNGRLVPVDDEAALSTAILDLINNDNKRRQYSSLGRIAALKYDISNVAKAYHEIYETCSYG